MCRHGHVVMSSVEWPLENSWLGVWTMVGLPVPGTSLGRDSRVLGVSGWSILVHQVVSCPLSLIPGSPIVEIAPARMIQNLGLSKGPEALLWPAWGSGWQPPTAPKLWLGAPAGSHPVATAHGWTEPTHSPSRAPGSLGFFFLNIIHPKKLGCKADHNKGSWLPIGRMVVTWGKRSRSLTHTKRPCT